MRRVGERTEQGRSKDGAGRVFFEKKLLPYIIKQTVVSYCIVIG